MNYNYTLIKNKKVIQKNKKNHNNNYSNYKKIFLFYNKILIQNKNKTQISKIILI